MKTFFYSMMAAVVTCSLWISCSKDKETEAENELQVFAASGDITGKLNEFRQRLGGQLNTSPGNETGRREINWDAVPDSFENVNLPADFFNPVGPSANVALQRGFRYLPTAAARVSGNSFAGLEPTNAAQFSAFSGSKTFATVGSNIWNVEFEVPGQPIAASVQGFGAVFSDVDTDGSTAMQFFSGTESLGIFKIPVRTTGSHSFLGVYFPNKKITRVEILQGSAPVGAAVKDISAGGTNDLVLMDDFLYNEPKAD
ncbi:MAG: hypothetical protein H7Y86_16755 [Rhizobacter sp.]|nr:hypothetical protein [Ferruginibacter sp.]